MQSTADSKYGSETPKPCPRGDFENFMRLPAEIRILIWHYGLVLPRVIKFDSRFNIQGDDFRRGHNRRQLRLPLVGSFRQTSKQDLSPLLHVCREARDEALSFGGFKDCRGYSYDVPLKWIRPKGLIAERLPFRPDIDIAFISSYEQYKSIHDHLNYSRVREERNSIFSRRLKRVVLPKSVAQALVKNDKNGATVFDLSKVMVEFPGMEELTISFTESLDVDGKVTDWERLAERPRAQLIVNEAPSRKLIINIAPPVWATLHMFLRGH